MLIVMPVLFSKNSEGKEAMVVSRRERLPLESLYEANQRPSSYRRRKMREGKQRHLLLDAYEMEDVHTCHTKQSRVGVWMICFFTREF